MRICYALPPSFFPFPSFPSRDILFRPIYFSLPFLLLLSLFPSSPLKQKKKKKKSRKIPVTRRGARCRASNHAAKTRILVLRQYDTDEYHLTVRVNTRHLLLHLRAGGSYANGYANGRDKDARGETRWRERYRKVRERGGGRG